MASNRLDIIVFGATGYTGTYAVKYAARFCKEWQLKFGIAGRRMEALEAVLQEFALDAGDVPIILADVNDEESLKKMTERAKVIVNCCGPYRFYGEQVIKACIATRTNHVDVSAESQFLGKMQLLYDQAAREAGVYIVGSCGFDCIPCDLGIIYTQKAFEGEINSVEAYVTFEEMNTGPVANSGTWESAVYWINMRRELKEIHAKLYPDKLPDFMPKLKHKFLLHKSEFGLSTAYPGADCNVVFHTQRFLHKNYQQRPVQVCIYAATPRITFLEVKVVICGIIFFFMGLTEFTRRLLVKHPVFFSYGLISDKFSHKLLENTRFSIHFKAKGWSEKLSKATDKHAGPPNKKLLTKISGPEPAYGTTSIAAILSAIMIIKEADKIPDTGVLTPGIAFGNTSLMEQLNKNGIKFEVIKSVEK